MALCESLKSNTSLTVLNLSCNVKEDVWNNTFVVFHCLALKQFNANRMAKTVTSNLLIWKCPLGECAEVLSPFLWRTYGWRDFHSLSTIEARKAQKKRKKDYDTWCSQVVSNPSTNQARRGLTSLIRREVVLSSWYGRNSSFFLSPATPFWLESKRRMVCVMSNKHTKVARGQG